MEINTKIIEIEKKIAKNGKHYHRVNTGDGWFSCFEKDIISDLQKYVGGMCNLAIAKPGDFKNIIGLVDNSVNEKAPIVKPEDYKKLITSNPKKEMYVSYAKDIFIAMWNYRKADADIDESMTKAISLVKQAADSFE